MCCHSIQVPGDPGARLQAIWIDHGMAEFERQFEAVQHAEKELSEGAVDEPGGTWQRRRGLSGAFVEDRVG